MRDKGSGEYYTFNGVMTSGAFGLNYEFPTAPMYKDAESYSGRCRVWLKSYVMGNEECRDLERNHLANYPVFRLKTPTHNNYDSQMVTNGMSAETASRTNDTGFTFAEWNGAFPRYVSMDENDERITAVGGPIGTYAIAGDEIQTGDTLTFNRAADLETRGGLTSTGGRKNCFLVYENNNYHPANAYVIGSPWGQTIQIDFKVNSLLDNGLNNGNVIQYEGRIFWSIVIEPLINEPKHSHSGC